VNDETKRDCLSILYDSNADTVITFADGMFRTVLDRLSQLVGENSNPKSLSIVPLIYTYNHQGNYSRNLLYGLMYWLFSGDDDTIRIRKVALSAVRGYFEHFLFDFKDQLTHIASKKGGNFKSTKDIAETIDKVVKTLVTSTGSYNDGISIIVKELGFSHREPAATRSRTASRTQRNAINIEHIFKSNSRCPICDGVIDLKQGKQYDHYFQKFSEHKLTEISNLKPTHPFCNNMKDTILEAKAGRGNLRLPDFLTDTRREPGAGLQLSLFDF
jgi:hypothetical protein